MDSDSVKRVVSPVQVSITLLFFSFFNKEEPMSLLPCVCVAHSTIAIPLEFSNMYYHFYCSGNMHQCRALPGTAEIAHKKGPKCGKHPYSTCYPATNVHQTRSMGPGLYMYKSFGRCDFADFTLADDDSNPVLQYNTIQYSVIIP